MKKQNEEDSEKFMEMFNKLGQTFGPMFLKNQEINAPIIKRQQWMNFLIMITLCIGVIVLAYFKIIDGSAATGLIGAVIGYVFGHIYSKREK